MLLRKLHAYCAIFAAPSLLFFALTGALQLFNLHEAHGSYRPPVLLEELANVHKKQVFGVRHRGPEHPGDDHGGGPQGPQAQRPGQGPRPGSGAATLLLKWFFLAASLSLVSSTVLGLWIGLRQLRRKRIGWVLLALGTVIPVGLLVA